MATEVGNTLREILQSVTMRGVLCMILVLGFLEIHRVHEAIQILCGNQLQLPSFVISLQVFCNQLGNQLEVEFRNFVDGIQILSNNQLQPHNVFSALFAFIAAITTYFLLRPRKVFLVDFACYKPDYKNALSKQQFLNFAAATGMYSDESLEFKRKILERSSMSDDCFMFKPTLPIDRSVRAAREEAQANIFSSLDELFSKTGVRPEQVQILVVNCSLFNPTPSLSAMIVNRYKMRGDIKSVNLGGMGCSAGLIAIDLAKDMLRIDRRAAYAVVCSQEILAQSPYYGNDRAKLVTNCLFKLGGAAVLLSNRSWEGWTRAKYELVHTVRTHTGASDQCYQCVYQDEDENGQKGVTLKKELMSVAGDALKTNITTLGPLVLPITEQLRFVISLLARKVLPRKHRKPLYIPDFKKAFEHFCIHAGGRAVLDEIQKNLKLSDSHMEPSRMTLYRFGNTSSSSLWYELAYAEAKGRVQRGDRVWQIAFGSGFKCNSAVWKALRTIHPPTFNPWNDVIHQFPIKEIPECKLELPKSC